jgi:hypothetical protein
MTDDKKPKKNAGQVTVKSEVAVADPDRFVVEMERTIGVVLEHQVDVLLDGISADVASGVIKTPVPTTEVVWVIESKFCELLRVAADLGLDGVSDLVVIHHLRWRAQHGQVKARRHHVHGWWEYEVDLPVDPGYATKLAADIAATVLRTHRGW